MNPIPDIIEENLKVLFVGFNPSMRSGQTGHHFANPTNRFWTILHQAGLTSKKYTAEEDQTLLNLGYGFTNIVARPTKAADEITNEEYEQGRVLLREKIEQYKPKLVCFVGKGVYLKYSKRKKAPWGKQTDETVKGVIDFVAPSSSGLVRMKVDEIVAIYNQLKPLIKE
ncbi:G/U mismatch-specific DNA glycosylase [Bacillus sp. Marseille-P3661]|uniref:G/U mismatch-specific DNA glycosylase n=1 Tax=Bacillus sp. Marseille-P3661 TaxID=1936234 RepID=UPI000C82604A|nr:G/U mismatch-specific DNA glycosylase [Bacillus sp. Marseille-P3661]